MPELHRDYGGLDLIKNNTIKEYFLITIASFLVATCVFFFLMPSHTALGSVTGLAIVLTNFTPLSVATLTLIMNLILLVVGFIFVGKEFGAKTVYTSIAIPLFQRMYEILLPDNKSLTGSQTLDALTYIVSVSFAMAMLFSLNASSGGLDIITKIMNKYFHMEIGKSFSILGTLIALTAALAYDSKTVVISVLGTYFQGIVLDHFIFGRNIKRRVCILSDHQDEIIDYVLHTLHSGASIYEVKGAYDQVIRQEVLVIVDKNEYQKLMTFLSKTDPKAFVTVYNVGEVRYNPKPVE